MVIKKWNKNGKDYNLIYSEEEEKINKLNKKINDQYNFLKQTTLIPIKNIDIINYSELYNLDNKITDIKYIDKKRNCVEKYTINNGIKDGIYRQYYIKKKDEKEEEILILEANYKEGKLDGKCTVWYPFNTLSILKECYYIEGIPKNKCDSL